MRTYYRGISSAAAYGDAVKRARPSRRRLPYQNAVGWFCSAFSVIALVALCTVAYRLFV